MLSSTRLSLTKSMGPTLSTSRSAALPLGAAPSLSFSRRRRGTPSSRTRTTRTSASSSKVASPRFSSSWRYDFSFESTTAFTRVLTPTSCAGSQQREKGLGLPSHPSPLGRKRHPDHPQGLPRKRYCAAVLHFVHGRPEDLALLCARRLTPASLLTGCRLCVRSSSRVPPTKHEPRFAQERLWERVSGRVCAF